MHSLNSPYLAPSSSLVYAVRFPLAFFLGVSPIVRPVKRMVSRANLPIGAVEGPLSTLKHPKGEGVQSAAKSNWNVVHHRGKTYWVGAIASTSRPSRHPSRPGCTGDVGIGP